MKCRDGRIIVSAIHNPPFSVLCRSINHHRPLTFFFLLINNTEVSFFFTGGGCIRLAGGGGGGLPGGAGGRGGGIIRAIPPSGIEIGAAADPGRTCAERPVGTPTLDGTGIGRDPAALATAFVSVCVLSLSFGVIPFGVWRACGCGLGPRPGLTKKSNPSPSSSDEMEVASDSSEEGECRRFKGSLAVVTKGSGVERFESFGRSEVPFEVSFVRLTGRSSISPSSNSTASIVRGLDSFGLGTGGSDGGRTGRGGGFDLPSGMRPEMGRGLGFVGFISFVVDGATAGGGSIDVGPDRASAAESVKVIPVY